MHKKKLIVDSQLLTIILDRLCQELVENHGDFSQSVIFGLQPRGIYFAEWIHEKLCHILKKKILLGYLDPTFHRDDFRQKKWPTTANQMRLPFFVEKKNVILIDDVLYTGRTVRAALDALVAFGRPKKVELLVLIDRKYTRELPIAADYVGHFVNTHNDQHILVEIEDTHKDSKIWIIKKE